MKSLSLQSFSTSSKILRCGECCVCHRKDSIHPKNPGLWTSRVFLECNWAQHWKIMLYWLIYTSYPLISLCLCVSLCAYLFVFVFFSISMLLCLSFWSPHSYPEQEFWPKIYDFLDSWAVANWWILGAFMIGCGCVFLELKTRVSIIFSRRSAIRNNYSRLISWPMNTTIPCLN